MRTIDEYLKEGFKPLMDEPERYLIHEDGRVMAFCTKQKRKPVLLKKSKSKGIDRYNLYLKNYKHGKYASVNMIRYCALHDCSLESIRGKVIYIDGSGNPKMISCYDNLTRARDRRTEYYPPAGDKKILEKWRDTFEAQMCWYKNGDLSKLLSIINQTRPNMVAYAIKSGVSEGIAVELTEEAIATYMEKICRYTFIVCALQKYLCKIVKKMIIVRRERRKAIIMANRYGN